MNADDTRIDETMTTRRLEQWLLAKQLELAAAQLADSLLRPSVSIGTSATLHPSISAPFLASSSAGSHARAPDAPSIPSDPAVHTSNQNGVMNVLRNVKNAVTGCACILPRRSRSRSPAPTRKPSGAKLVVVHPRGDAPPAQPRPRPRRKPVPQVDPVAASSRASVLVTVAPPTPAPSVKLVPDITPVTRSAQIKLSLKHHPSIHVQLVHVPYFEAPSGSLYKMEGWHDFSKWLDSTNDNGGDRDRDRADIDAWSTESLKDSYGQTSIGTNVTWTTTIVS